MTHQFYITDVFSEGPYSGNQLATLFDAADLSTEEMQLIAREFNFAETTFVLGGNQETGFEVRIFTPRAELPFAGHPTLGTAFLIRQQVLNNRANSLCLNLAAGKIQVFFASDGVVWMSQWQPEFGKALEPAEVAASLGLTENQLDPELPVRFVSTGVEFLIVPVLSLAVLRSIKVSHTPCAKAMLVYCAGGYTKDQAIAARMFAADLGVAEDAATGSANGCLAAYLLEYSRAHQQSVDLVVGQGYEINRPSQLYLRASKTKDEFDIKVGGHVRLVAQGEWLV